MLDFSSEELSMSGAARLSHYYRARILNGTLAEGSRLPSTMELAKLFNMSAANTQRALLPLVNAGMIRRLPHYGTVVCKVKPEFRAAAIIHCVDFSIGIPRYHQELTTRLTDELHRQGYESVILYRDMQDLTTDQVIGAIRRSGVQGIIPLSAPSSVFNMLKQVNLPAVSDAMLKRYSNVRFNLQDLALHGPPLLAEAGCRRPAIILNMPESMDSMVQTLFIRDCRKFCSLLRENFTSLGMNLSPERIFRFGKFLPIPEERYAEEAYLAVKRMAALPEPPDGYFVYSDAFTDGVSAALLELKQTKLPVLIHVNTGIKHFLPFHRIEAVTDLGEMARVMVMMLLAQFRGEKTTQQRLPFRFRRVCPDR